MDVENMLEAEDKLNSAILLEGNYFIMDSEQLVSNPFQELQQEAAQEAQKKNSMTERLTSVKNNVCENHFQMEKSRLERQKTSKLKNLHDHSNKLRHEVKLLDLDRQRHQVEVKKRLDPEKDFTYDDGQIVNIERRLGANIASFYLDKKLKYPMRLRSVSDISVTPTVRKARQSLRLQDLKRSMDDANVAGRAERVQTAKSSSTALTAHSGLARRRGSRSAPLYAARSAAGVRAQSERVHNTMLPAIAGAAQPDSHEDGKPKTAPQSHQVKFAFENPLKILASSEESANLFARGHTYYPGLTRAVNTGLTDSSDEDDDPYPSEVIDLRALLFKDGETANAIPTTTNSINLSGFNIAQIHPAGSHHHHQHNDDLASLSHGSGPAPGLSLHHLAALRKAQGPPPKLTTDMMQVENEQISAKINKFLGDLAVPRRLRHGYDSSDEEEDDARAIQRPGDFFANVAAGGGGGSGGGGGGGGVKFFASTGVRTDDNPPNPFLSSNTKSTSTSDLLGVNNHNNNENKNVFAKNNSNNNTNNASTTTADRPTGVVARIKTTSGGSEGGDERGDEDEAGSKSGEKPPHKNKYGWQYIRGRPADGQLRGTYKSEDLVLQSLTGVPIRNALGTHVPLNSASRAMRHTATFKMHKIVERLIQERTKYERHQVEELKRQMATDEPGTPHTATGPGPGPGPGLGPSPSPAHPSRRVSRVSNLTVTSR
ncbi:uncharacterized protein LOC101862118 isoform X2 [Aplysia californica]|uniref:Uncharacterized protein LOC101862118 isoform X2 n=1 Tax=Aplysia californica TaxID=6500 RepID=A0ABM0JTS4_APLCA|nr:uncharacterized protein LOC101862118 isoform X2 [Aplysia californica]